MIAKNNGYADVDEMIKSVREKKEKHIEVTPEDKLLREREEFYESEISRFSAELEKIQQNNVKLANMEHLLSQIKNRLEDVTEEEKAELMKLLINKVWVDGQGQVTIEFTIPHVIPENLSSTLYHRYGGPKSRVCAPFPTARGRS